MLQKIVEKNKKLSKYIGYYGELLSRTEENLQELGEKKPDLKREVSVYRN